MAAEGQSERIVELERLLEEATETLDAIRNGEVDAIVVGAAAGQIVYTLENADRPYRVLVEQMREGAVTLNADGLLLYANHSFGKLVGRPVASLLGTCLFDYLADATALVAMLAGDRPAIAEVKLIAATGEQVSVTMSIVELQVETGAHRHVLQHRHRSHRHAPRRRHTAPDPENGCGRPAHRRRRA